MCLINFEFLEVKCIIYKNHLSRASRQKLSSNDQLQKHCWWNLSRLIKGFFFFVVLLKDCSCRYNALSLFAERDKPTTIKISLIIFLHFKDEQIFYYEFQLCVSFYMINKTRRHFRQYFFFSSLVSSKKIKIIIKKWVLRMSVQFLC